LIRVQIPPRIGSHRRPIAFCLEPHDLVLAKCVAGRTRDWNYTREAIRAGIVQPDELLRRVTLLPIDTDRQDHIRAMLEAITHEPAG
jgi:hypothetical protein